MKLDSFDVYLFILIIFQSVINLETVKYHSSTDMKQFLNFPEKLENLKIKKKNVFLHFCTINLKVFRQLRLILNIKNFYLKFLDNSS